MSLSTHVLDAVSGAPAVGVLVRLDFLGPDGWAETNAATTDADGRVREFGVLVAGVHRLTFDTGSYFAASGTPTFYPLVSITFHVGDPAAHHHVPLLLSPFAYSTYRGS